MKKMTCQQLGGACQQEFSANSFEEIAQLSQEHGKEMFAKGDEAHKAAMAKMMDLMQNPQEMQTWMTEKRQEFDALEHID